ncbi:peptidyl-lys metalloendopeptidase, partial [Rhizoctonia solani 123E]
MIFATTALLLSVLVSQTSAAPQFKAPISAPNSPGKVENEPTSKSHDVSITRKMNDDQFISCEHNQQLEVEKAAVAANVLVANGVLYIENSPPDEQPLYTTWFGKHDEDNYATVVSTVSKMHNMATLLTYNCTSCSMEQDAAKKRKPLYSTKNDDGSTHTIDLCEGFWKAPMVGYKSRAGSIVAELAVMLGKTVYSNVWTELASKTTATRDPKLAVQSSRNYMY